MTTSSVPPEALVKNRYPWMQIPLFKKPLFWLILIGVIAAVLKVVLLMMEAVPFNADEAVVALMARHILQGERPIFFYGQAYMGSLDAFLTAGGFAVFGQQVWVVRLVQGLLYLGTILTTYLIGKNVLGSRTTGLVAATLMAVPTVNVTLYTTASLGGYGEALLLGNLILLTAFAAGTRLRSGDWRLGNMAARFLLWGLLVGVGLWANALTLIYSFPAGLYLLWQMVQSHSISRSWSCLLAALAGFLAGSFPWWTFAVQNGLGQLVQELGGSAVAVEQNPFIIRIFEHFYSLLLLGGTVIFGLRPPWSVDWLALPLLPFALLIWAGVIVLSVRGTSKKVEHWEERRALGGVFWTLAAGFIFTSFGVDPSGRYFIPVYGLLALAMGEGIQHLNLRWVWRALVIGIVLVFNLWGTLQMALRNPPGITTQFYNQTILDHRYMGELVEFLQEKGETRGYTTYWVAYPLAFRSHEELIFVPRLPYHTDLRYTSRDDRYAPYGEMMAQSPHTAYITARNPALDAHLQKELTVLGVSWQEKLIGDYHVYYGLSRAVLPVEIGLGEDTP